MFLKTSPDGQAEDMLDRPSSKRIPARVVKVQVVLVWVILVRVMLVKTVLVKVVRRVVVWVTAEEKEWWICNFQLYAFCKPYVSS